MFCFNCFAPGYNFWSSQGLSCKEFTRQTEDMGLIPGSGRSPGVGSGNSLQYSVLSYGQRILVGYSL